MVHPLTQYRLAEGLSGEAVAKRAGTSRQTIHRIESGAQFPSLTLIRRLIDATGGAVTADDFLPPRAEPEAAE